MPTTAMTTNPIPGTDLNVTRVCLGTMTFGEQCDTALSHRILDRAVDAGVNFLDTAEMYPVPARAETTTRTETILGEWLARSGNKPARDKLVIATKVSGPGRGMSWLRTGARAEMAALSADDIVAACDASLRRLQTDVIDLYQVHWPARNVPSFGAERYDPSREWPSEPIESQLIAFERLKKAGKVRAFGVSNETAWGVTHWQNEARRLGLPVIATVQNVYNLLSRSYETGLDEACFRERVGLLAYSPLAFGFLTGKYRKGLNLPENQEGRLSKFGAGWPRYQKARIAPAVERYAAIAEQAGMSLTDLALAFCYHRASVLSTIIGVTSEAQLDEDLQAWDRQLSADVLVAIDAVHAEIPTPAP